MLKENSSPTTACQDGPKKLSSPILIFSAADHISRVASRHILRNTESKYTELHETLGPGLRNPHPASGRRGKSSNLRPYLRLNIYVLIERCRVHLWRQYILDRQLSAISSETADRFWFHLAHAQVQALRKALAKMVWHYYAILCTT